MKITNNPKKTFISIRVEEEEKNRIKNHARKKGLSVGEFLLSLARKEILNVESK